VDRGVLQAETSRTQVSSREKNRVFSAICRNVIGTPPPLRAIIDQALAPFRDPQHDRFQVQGPELRLSPRMALDLAMALHELATNAVKYGALSNASGTVGLTWEVDGGSAPPRLKLRWQERGGPAVEPPGHRGFGTRLIERSLVQDLGGEAWIEFAPAGVVCTIDTLAG
jgi:two-component sensor histidine kinase